MPSLMRPVWAGSLVAGVTVAVLLGPPAAAAAGDKVYVGRACKEQNRPALSAVDHAAFDALLRKYVDDKGMVAYAEWKKSDADVKALDDYLAALGCVDLTKAATKEGQLAFWINAYNAVTIRGILREYPTKSIRNHTAKAVGYNIWKDLLLAVDGRSVSLDDIEHQVLRKMGEPRIHFAIVCASVGCPPLRNRAFTIDKLGEQLDASAKAFFANPANLKLDPRNRTVEISQIIEWFGKDFAATSPAQLAAVRKHFPQSDAAAWVEAAGVTVKYLEYDWSLNDQTPARK
ncbi:Secreted protein containing DUF547 OS=Rhodopirellula sp. SWK7 GN=RRSWK_02046 PE=4 SV=1: DUF547 [Gemmataceae bacterium]|nr:Secreted protein containing DUF547 OS=Rhodopirellula sp. SWK7 GN=RRSWK_02046 PE=4 SV=1: DUF547 [Gemmataceae bacterium]VTT99563.1 Secreted protein containing DUF547 OS=Rhodopirellula sp. SWK7 GN=RRSWK_02046 PE=4 SV=1: DUF547 [Gemmataceae bacterium]